MSKNYVHQVEHLCDQEARERRRVCAGAFAAKREDAESPETLAKLESCYSHIRVEKQCMGKLLCPDESTEYFLKCSNDDSLQTEESRAECERLAGTLAQCMKRFYGSKEEEED